MQFTVSFNSLVTSISLPKLAPKITEALENYVVLGLFFNLCFFHTVSDRKNTAR